MQYDQQDLRSYWLKCSYRGNPGGVKYEYSRIKSGGNTSNSKTEP